jgi:hypothetical protein
MRGCGTPWWILAQTWRERGSCRRFYLLKLVKLCQYNSQIHRVPAGRIVTNKQTITRQLIVKQNQLTTPELAKKKFR